MRVELACVLAHNAAICIGPALPFTGHGAALYWQRVEGGVNFRSWWAESLLLSLSKGTTCGAEVADVYQFTWTSL